MGIRLTLAVGYGMQLTDEQLKAFDPDDAEKKMVEYIDQKLKECMEFKRTFNAVQDQDQDFFEKSLVYLEYRIFLDDKKGNKPYYLNSAYHDVERIVREIFAFPAKEWGTDSFLGYVLDKRHDDTIDYVVVEAMGMKSCKNFEIHVPVTIDVREMNRDGKTFYLPVTGSAILHETLKKRKESGKNGTDVFFQSKEACMKETIAIAKEMMYMDSVHYTRGLELVKVLFPEITMERIEKYLVGWWS